MNNIKELKKSFNMFLFSEIYFELNSEYFTCQCFSNPVLEREDENQMFCFHILDLLIS